MEQTLDFMKNSTLWEKINFYFSVTFASIDKIYILGERLGIRL